MLNASYAWFSVSAAEYKFYYKSYESPQAIKSQYAARFIDKLMSLNTGNDVWVLWDNARIHKSIAEEYEAKYTGRLHFILLPLRACLPIVRI